MKTCKKCGHPKPLTEFYSDVSKRDGVGSYCKKCRVFWGKDYRAQNKEKIKAWKRNWAGLNVERRRDYLRKYRYNLDDAVFCLLLKTQQNCCAICAEPFNRPRDIHIDHDHVSKGVRGLLCQGCNQGLGNFRDSVPRLRAAMEYLENTKQTQT